MKSQLNIRSIAVILSAIIVSLYAGHVTNDHDDFIPYSEESSEHHPIYNPILTSHQDENPEDELNSMLTAAGSEILRPLYTSTEAYEIEPQSERAQNPPSSRIQFGGFNETDKYTLPSNLTRIDNITVPTLEPTSDEISSPLGNIFRRTKEAHENPVPKASSESIPNLSSHDSKQVVSDETHAEEDSFPTIDKNLSRTVSVQITNPTNDVISSMSSDMFQTTSEPLNLPEERPSLESTPIALLPQNGLGAPDDTFEVEDSISPPTDQELTSEDSIDQVSSNQGDEYIKTSETHGVSEFKPESIPIVDFSFSEDNITLSGQSDNTDDKSIPPPDDTESTVEPVIYETSTSPSNIVLDKSESIVKPTIDETLTEPIDLSLATSETLNVAEFGPNLEFSTHPSSPQGEVTVPDVTFKINDSAILQEGDSLDHDSKPPSMLNDEIVSPPSNTILVASDPQATTLLEANEPQVSNFRVGDPPVYGFDKLEVSETEGPAMFVDIYQIIFYTIFCIVSVSTVVFAKHILGGNIVAMKDDDIKPNTKHQLKMDHQAVKQLQTELETLKDKKSSLVRKLKEQQARKPIIEEVKRLRSLYGSNIRDQIYERKTILRTIHAMKQAQNENRALMEKVQIAMYEQLVMIVVWVNLQNLPALLEDFKFRSKAISLEESSNFMEAEAEFYHDHTKNLEDLREFYAEEIEKLDRELVELKNRNLMLKKALNELREDYDLSDALKRIDDLKAGVANKEHETDEYYRKYLYNFMNTEPLYDFNELDLS